MKAVYFAAAYFIVINLVAVVICVIDKKNARMHITRISEKTLFAVSVCGGAVGMYVTMLKIRHKTKHKRFMIGLPVIIVLQAVFAVAVLLDKAGALA